MSSRKNCSHVEAFLLRCWFALCTMGWRRLFSPGANTPALLPLQLGPVPCLAVSPSQARGAPHAESVQLGHLAVCLLILLRDRLLCCVGCMQSSVRLALHRSFTLLAAHVGPLRGSWPPCACFTGLLTLGILRQSFQTIRTDTKGPRAHTHNTSL